MKSGMGRRIFYEEWVKRNIKSENTGIISHCLKNWLSRLSCKLVISRLFLSLYFIIIHLVS